MKPRTVGLVACERKEQIARFYRAAVDRKSLDDDGFRLAGDRSVIAERGREVSCCSSRPRPRAICAR